jgi:hypothetical protein
MAGTDFQHLPVFKPGARNSSGPDLIPSPAPSLIPGSGPSILWTPTSPSVVNSRPFPSEKLLQDDWRPVARQRTVYAALSGLTSYSTTLITRIPLRHRAVRPSMKWEDLY